MLVGLLSVIGYEVVSTKKLRGRKADIIASGLKTQSTLLGTQGSLLKNKLLQLSLKAKLSENTTPVSKLSTTLDLVSISNDVALEPYWNDACRELQSALWLPPTTDSQKEDSTLSNGQLSYTAAKLSNWKSQNQRTGLTPASLFVSLPHSSHPTTASEVVVAKKVRVYPEDETQWANLIGLHRVAYNMAIAAINLGKQDKTELRRKICEELRIRWLSYGSVFVASVSNEAVCLAFDTLYKCIKRWKKGEKAKLGFRSRRDVSQGFTVQKATEDGQLFPRFLGKTTLTEKLDFDVTGQMVRVTRVRGRYFVSFKHKVLLSENQTGNKVVAIDPGIRTFATSYSLDEVNKYGSGLDKSLLQMSQKIDGLKSVRDKITSLKLWAQQRRKNLQNRIWNLQNRISDLVSDLHRKVAFDLVSSYDIIFLPTFATSQMVSKKPGRKIRKNTVRSMQSFRFFEFSLHLAWMCKKYGKTLIRVNESYTSKTDSRDGTIKQIGSAKTINGLDRDTNGARGILLRALSRGICPQTIRENDASLSFFSV